MGILFILLGVDMYFDENAGWYSGVYKTYIDVSNVHKPYGLILLISGVCIVIAMSKKNYKPTPGNLICPTCENVFLVKHLKNTFCPKCHVQLVDIKGFYSESTEKNKKNINFLTAYSFFWLFILLLTTIAVGPSEILGILMLALPLIVIIIAVPFMFARK